MEVEKQTEVEEVEEVEVPSFTADSIAIAVATKVASSGDEVAEAVVNALAGREIDVRIKIISKIIEDADKAKSELKKIDRPDKEGSFKADGTEASPPTYSKERLNQIKALKEKINGYDLAVKKALTDDNWDKARKLGN